MCMMAETWAWQHSLHHSAGAFTSVADKRSRPEGHPDVSNINFVCIEAAFAQMLLRIV